MGHIPESNPDLSCPRCRGPHIITGETPEARAEALAGWRGCCIQNPPAAGVLGEVTPASGASLLARFRRRFHAWPFGAPDYTTGGGQ